jgi:hypothetical protein
MKEETKHSIYKLGLKFVLLVVVLVALNFLYSKTLYLKDLEENCTLMPLSELAAKEKADIVYIGESSDITYSKNDKDNSRISGFLGKNFPQYVTSSLSKSACHAGVYYDVLRNIPDSSQVKIAVVTVNMRSFSSEWIYSELETALQKEQIFMKKVPPLIKRGLIAFKAYNHWSERERMELVVNGFKKQTFSLPYELPFRNAYDWDLNMSSKTSMPQDSITIDCHYIKNFEYQLNADNPRIKDLDKIVKLCKQRNWKLVFNILPDNVEQIQRLVGNDLVTLMNQNAQYIINRYAPLGVIVVNNQTVLSDAEFIERKFPSEHYIQSGRERVAKNIATAIQAN